MSVGNPDNTAALIAAASASYGALTFEDRRAFRDMLASWLFRAAAADAELEELRP